MSMRSRYDAPDRNRTTIASRTSGSTIPFLKDPIDLSRVSGTRTRFTSVLKSVRDMRNDSLNSSSLRTEVVVQNCLRSRRCRLPLRIGSVRYSTYNSHSCRNSDNKSIEHENDSICLSSSIENLNCASLIYFDLKNTPGLFFWPAVAKNLGQVWPKI